MYSTARPLPDGGSFALCALLLIASMAGHLISDTVCESPGGTVAARCEASGSRVFSSEHADSSAHASLVVSTGSSLDVPAALTIAAGPSPLLPLAAVLNPPFRPPRVPIARHA